MQLLCQVKSTHVTAQRTREFCHFTLDGSHPFCTQGPPLSFDSVLLDGSCLKGSCLSRGKEEENFRRTEMAANNS